MLAEIADRCGIVEECYEFMLAYAARGLPGDPGSQSDKEVREFLQRAIRAIDGLPESCATAVKQEGLEPVARYEAFIAVLDRDASSTLAAIELVKAQPAISSQFVDNLNASIHLRAFLTDLFLLDEILKTQRQQRRAVS